MLKMANGMIPKEIPKDKPHWGIPKERPKEEIPREIKKHKLPQQKKKNGRNVPRR